jgi:hypothetical protein
MNVRAPKCLKAYMRAKMGNMEASGIDLFASRANWDYSAELVSKSELNENCSKLYFVSKSARTAFVKMVSVTEYVDIAWILVLEQASRSSILKIATLGWILSFNTLARRR